MAPTLAIETVAAGGGSVCRFDGHQLKVGPESAGASPGPACYGAGGPLTLTDVNLLLGRLEPSAFEIPIDTEAAREAAVRLQGQVNAGGNEISMLEMLEGLLQIANERMAEAVRRISIRRGYKPSEFALVAFGGAGGQHACALAEILDIETVLVPEDAGLLSAVGLGAARVERFAERQVLEPLDVVSASLEALLEQLSREAIEAVAREGIQRSLIEFRRKLLYLRFEGQESTLAVEAAASADPREAFYRSYEDHYGYRPEERALELESVRVVASSAGSRPDLERRAAELGIERATLSQRRRAFMAGAWQPVWVYERRNMGSGFEFDGPALVFERHCSTVVSGGWRGRVDSENCLVLTRDRSSRQEER